METLTPASEHATKSELYAHICEQLQGLLGNETDRIANAANTTSLLFHLLPDVNWAGFYYLHGHELVLGPFQGKPACVRIPVGRGVCGAAAEQRQTVVVPDVNAFPGHIACDSASRSEIVVPLVNWGRVIGVLDVDSPLPGRFDEEDREGLESIVAILLAADAGNDMPDLTDADAELD